MWMEIPYNIKLPIELGPWEGSGTRSNGYEKGGTRPSERPESGTELNVSVGEKEKPFINGCSLRNFCTRHQLLPSNSDTNFCLAARVWRVWNEVL